MTAETGAFGVMGRGPHDWHSPEYVHQWVAENEARLEERGKQVDLLAGFIPHAAGAPIRILEAGAGWGTGDAAPVGAVSERAGGAARLLGADVYRGTASAGGLW